VISSKAETDMCLLAGEVGLYFFIAIFITSLLCHSFEEFNLLAVGCQLDIGFFEGWPSTGMNAHSLHLALLANGVDALYLNTEDSFYSLFDLGFVCILSTIKVYFFSCMES
jgi:hypothetical protein